MSIVNCALSIDLPLASILIPICNEAAFIARSLGAVLAREYPAERKVPLWSTNDDNI